jgi:hypothetical protein
MHDFPARRPRLRFRASLLVACLGLLVVAVAPLAAARAEGPDPAPGPEAVELSEALNDLAKLDDALKSKKSINDEIIQYLDLVGLHFRAIKGPAAPPEGAEADVVDAYEKALKDHQKNVADYRKKAEKLIFKAFGLTRLQRTTNLRDEVNLKAAQVIGALGAAFPGTPAQAKEDDVAKDNLGEREDLAKKLRKEIEGLHKIKYDRNTDVLQAAFAALGDLNTLDSVEWMIENYSHAKNNEVDWLVAAHKALVKFTDVPGKLRFDLVEQFIRTYSGVESAANTSSTDPKDQAKKRFWDDIRTFTVPVVQMYSGNPVDAETNEALSTMAQFDEWFRDHKNPRKAPWVDGE